MEKVEEIKPYDADKEKPAQVEQMFDSIAPAYDFLNTALSFGQHLRWRDYALRRLIERIKKKDEKCYKILDVATGTGALAFRLADFLPQSLVTGIDLSAGMLEIAKKRLKKYPGEKIDFIKGDCLALPFADDRFDAVTVAYGVRNFADLPRGLKEMRRVLKPDGSLCVIELSEPKNKILYAGYKLYSDLLLPLVGRLLSHDKKAYKYLPQSIAAAPQRDKMERLMLDAGFSSVDYKSLTFGVVTIYLAQK